MPRSLASVAGALTALALLLFGLTGIICCVAGDVRGLTREMQRFAPPEATGLPADAYPELGQHLSDYLTGKKDSFQYALENAAGEAVLLFHDYELLHMADCRSLLSFCLTFCLCSGGLGLLGLAFSAMLGSSARFRFARGALTGLWGCCGIAVGLVCWAVINFDGFFVTFHRLAFRNDLWLLNPRTDLLIRLMPETLFEDLGLRGLLAAGIFTLLLVLGFVRLRQRYSSSARS